MFDKTKPVFMNWMIKEKIGEGSYGTVYELERQKDDFLEDMPVQKSALKVISIPKDKNEIDHLSSSGMDPQDITTYYKKYAQKIYREIELMANLSECRHVVRYMDHQVIPHEDGAGYDILLRMELLTPFMKYLKNHTVDQSEILRLGTELCDALEQCENMNIIHRDIKPANIFVSDKGEFKLGDYGIARTASSTTAGTMAGTYTYMAPEVFKGEKYNKTVDIYSLGLVLYQYLNGGRLPFMPPIGEKIQYGDLEKANQMRLLGAQIPPIPGASDELNQVLLKACSYDAQNRYADAKAFKNALKECVDIQEEKEENVEEIKINQEETSILASEEEADDAMEIEEAPEEDVDKTVSFLDAQPVKDKEAEESEGAEVYPGTKENKKEEHETATELQKEMRNPSVTGGQNANEEKGREEGKKRKEKEANQSRASKKNKWFIALPIFLVMALVCVVLFNNNSLEKAMQDEMVANAVERVMSVSDELDNNREYYIQRAKEWKEYDYHVDGNYYHINNFMNLTALDCDYYQIEKIKNIIGIDKFTYTKKNEVEIYCVLEANGKNVVGRFHFRYSTDKKEPDIGLLMMPIAEDTKGFIKSYQSDRYRKKQTNKRIQEGAAHERIYN